MRTVIISQARMNSTRLPGKVLREVEERPLLQYHVERLQRVRGVSDVVVATTQNEQDEDIIRLCEQLGCGVFRGSERDVLSRYYGAAREFAADTVIRVTSDCPMIDPQVVERVLQHYQRVNDYDYVSNTLYRTYPRGMDTEVFSFSRLEEAFREASHPYEREHVTPFLYRQPQRYRIGSVQYRENLSDYRWTVDTEDDFELIGRMLSTLFPDNPLFTLEDALAVLSRHPEWALVNANVVQKRMED